MSALTPLKAFSTRMYSAMKTAATALHKKHQTEEKEVEKKDARLGELLNNVRLGLTAASRRMTTASIFTSTPIGEKTGMELELPAPTADNATTGATGGGRKQ